MSLSPDSLCEEQIGDYRVQDELGRGGMGVVYRAQQISLKRQVALKVLSGSFSIGGHAVERFKREAAAAARLHHPHIVPIYSTGEDDGLHYYAMELIDGQSLDKVVSQMKAHRQAESFLLSTSIPADELEQTVVIDPDRKATPPPPSGDSSDTGHHHKSDGGKSTLFSTGRQFFDTLARMIADVADALSYAHQQGVIHRDIKPGNLILSQGGHVHVGDFGLARLMEEPGITVSGGVIGSPHYMSPEQVDPDRKALDHRSDIYSLGVTLYELLTLQTPFKGAGPENIVSFILSREPKAPRKLNRHVPQDLETICLKAMEKDPARRYQTGAEMAEDLRRYADRFSISARRVSLAGRALRWSQRHPAGAGLIIASVVLAVTLTSLWAANSFRNDLLRAIDGMDKAKDGEIRARKQVESYKNFLEYSIRVSDAYRALEDGDGPRARQLLLDITSNPELADLPGFEWRHLWQRSQQWRGRNIWQEQPGWKLSAASFSPDGSRLAISGSIKAIRIFSGMPDPPYSQTLLRGHAKWVNRVAHSASGDMLASASDDATVRLWDMTTNPPSEAGILEGHAQSVYEAKFSPDDSRLVSCSRDGTLKLWDVASRSLIATMDAAKGRIFSVAFAPDGSKVVASGADGAVRIWNLAGRELEATLSLHEGEVTSVDWSRDGGRIVSSDDKGRIVLTDARTHRVTTSVRGHDAGVFHVAFSPDGALVSSAGLDKTVKLWATPDLVPKKTLRGHRELVFLSQFSSDGRGLISVGMDGAAKL